MTRRQLARPGIRSDGCKLASRICAKGSVRLQRALYRWFWRRFDVVCGRIVVKQKEKMLALSGNATHTKSVLTIAMDNGDRYI